jgi:S-formylglutathione hydrolase FrmB
MKTSKILLFSFILTLMFWSCEQDVLPPHDPSNLEHKEFYSHAMEYGVTGNPTIKDMMVYTPPGYDTKKGKKYPVTYLLHGIPATDSAFIDQSAWDDFVGPGNTFQSYPDFPQEGFRLWVDNLIDQKIIDPMIIVMPDASTVIYSISFYTNSVLNGNFEDLIAIDLVQYMDANYRTINKPKGRAVIGFSQGGYGAMTLGMKHPDVFGAVASHSAPLVFEVIQYFLPIVQMENPNQIPTPGPNAPMTGVTFAMSSAWSPNLYNPPFFVDFPFDLVSNTVVESTWDRWLTYEPYNMLNTYGQNLNTLKGVFFDCGNQDEFAFWYGYENFAAELDALDVDYYTEIFNGGHFEQMFARLEISLGYCSDAIRH